MEKKWRHLPWETHHRKISFKNTIPKPTKSHVQTRLIISGGLCLAFKKASQKNNIDAMPPGNRFLLCEASKLKYEAVGRITSEPLLATSENGAHVVRDEVTVFTKIFVGQYCQEANFFKRMEFRVKVQFAFNHLVYIFIKTAQRHRSKRWSSGTFGGMNLFCILP